MLRRKGGNYMKVSKNVTIYAGNGNEEIRRQNLRKEAGKASESNGRDSGNNTIFSGNLNIQQDSVLMKKKMAQEKALKVIGDAWNGDRSIDEEVNLHREKARQLREDIKFEKDMIGAIRDREKEMQQNYGVADDSEEQKDAQLLLRWQEKDTLTEEEAERVEELQQNGLTEYQSSLLELNEDVVKHKEIADKAQQELEQENAIVRGIRLERLKSSPMLKAAKQAEKIKEAASEEIVNMLMEEGKEHIDEEQEKREEQAQEIKEKKEEQEELIEKRREDKEETEAFIEEILSEEILNPSQVQADIKKEIQNIVNKMNLVVEDIKGAAVDETL